ncbi:hypothetical protein [Texcoconibacillus texcoconensis]|uniref:Uncharacterized protein n=1 Tax=Texcoconibacillus texcoconensis TaxID=1095777 RepID=A0A840QRW4_9BACI|nr:hypothetical protein [Texcoconibacillus texcoconensis]MBB5174027.1 hypothetical protein [Texcoconibacillus texcoconensis]
MKNRIIYLTIPVISIIIILFTIRHTKKEHKKFLLPLFFALSGLNYIFESFVLVIGQGYEYKPKLLKNAYFDNVLGSVASQLFIVPATGTLVSILNLKYRWSLLISIILTTIELLFVKLKIFKQYWWSAAFTTIGILVFHAISKYWVKQLTEESNKSIRNMTVFLSILVSYITLNFLHVSFLKTGLFNIRLYKNPYRSHVAIATVYSLLFSAFISMSLLIKKGYIYLFAISSFLVLEIILIKNKAITVYNKLIYVLSPLTKLISIGTGRYVLKLLHSNEFHNR